MSIEKFREDAEKIIELLKEYSNVTIFMYEDGSGTIELDNVDFDVEVGGKISQTSIHF